MTTGQVELSGITWEHSRGISPMLVTAQRYSELNPEVRVRWDSRPLKAFADYSVTTLATQYDLIVFDHPWVGRIHKDGALLALESHLDEAFLADQEHCAVGDSYNSYVLDGHVYGLATDVAAPVSARRDDLFEKHSLDPPDDWESLLDLASRGLVGIPGAPIDMLMSFFMLCSTMQGGPLVADEWQTDDDVAIRSLQMLADLTRACGTRVLTWNPIALYETMVNTDTVAYSPFAFSYSNYSRQGYADHPLIFDDTIILPGHGKLITTLGGAGLGVSAATSNVDAACDYAQFVATGQVQKTLYFFAGGQPGHRSAWLDSDTNRASRGFFQNTLEAHDRAYLRPRFLGYIEFQELASTVVWEFVVHGGNAKSVVDQLKEAARQAKEHGGLT